MGYLMGKFDRNFLYYRKEHIWMQTDSKLDTQMRGPSGFHEC